MRTEYADMEMELDTGLGLSIIAYDVYCKYLADIHHLSTKCVMRSYSNQIIKIKGMFQVSVKKNDQF